MENTVNSIQVLPVSKRLEDPLKHIEWDSIRQIPEGAKVLVVGMWFSPLIPFLLKRNVKGIFLSYQQDRVEYANEYKQLYEAGWHFITLDRLSAMEHSIEYLYALERRKIAVVKSYKNELQHPYRLGMIKGYESCGLNYDEKNYIEIAPDISQNKLENEIARLWEEIHFDALVVGGSNFIKPIYSGLTRKAGLILPDDVALMSFVDNPSYLEFDSPVTAIVFPFIKVGKKVIELFNQPEFKAGESMFQSSIIERESTRKGTGAHVNHAFMPEISVNDDVSYIKNL